MVNLKHTPGPWKVVDCRNQKRGQIRIFSNAPGEWHQIANVLASNPNAYDDANVMAAAPEMLEVLLDLENDNGSIPAPIWNRIKAAIAKATGGNS